MNSGVKRAIEGSIRLLKKANSLKYKKFLI